MNPRFCRKVGIVLKWKSCVWNSQLEIPIAGIMQGSLLCHGFFHCLSKAFIILFTAELDPDF